MEIKATNKYLSFKCKTKKDLLYDKCLKMFSKFQEPQSNQCNLKEFKRYYAYMYNANPCLLTLQRKFKISDSLPVISQ